MYLFFLSLILFLSSAQEPYVTSLSDATFDSFLEEHPITFVKFYAVWCGHCQAFKPEYEKAAKIVKERNLPYALAELDAEKEAKTAKKYGISGFPTLMLFYNGQQFEYPDDRTVEAILSFIERKTAPQVSELKTAKDVKYQMVGEELRCIVVTDDHKEIEAVKATAPNFQEYRFYYTSYAIAKTALPEGYLRGPNAASIILFKPYDEKLAFYYPNLAMSFGAFLEAHSSPIVGPLTKQSQSLIYNSQNRIVVILFRSPISMAHSAAEEAVKAAGDKRIENVRFLLADPEEETGEAVGAEFGVDKNAVPALFATKLKEDLYRYKFNKEEITAENILAFIQDVKDDKAERFLKSEDEPAENQEPVFKVVAKTFEKEVLSTEDDVFVKFYAPWCGHCKHLAPIYVELAEKLKGTKGVKIVEVDATKNDIVGQQVNGFPTMKLYVSGKKDQPMEYNGERTVDDMMKFLKENAKNLKEGEEPKQEEPKQEEQNQGEAKTEESSQKDSGDVVQLTDKNWEELVANSNDDVLVKFYAPWCGHCQNLAPTYKELATKLKGSKGIKIAELDATKYTISGQEINGYPTIKLFPSQKKGSPVEYEGDRSIDDFMKFLKTNCKSYGEGEKKPVEAAPEQKKEEAPKQEGEVIVGTTQNWEQLVMKSNDDVFVKFYAPWCGHCQHMAPAYKELAKKIGQSGVKIVEVDATANTIPGQDINGYPTVKLFVNGKKSSPIEYEGDRSVDDMMKFLKEHCKNWQEVKQEANKAKIDL